MYLQMTGTPWDDRMPCLKLQSFSFYKLGLEPHCILVQLMVVTGDCIPSTPLVWVLKWSTTKS